MYRIYISLRVIQESLNVSFVIEMYFMTCLYGAGQVLFGRFHVKSITKYLTISDFAEILYNMPTGNYDTNSQANKIKKIYQN